MTSDEKCEVHFYHMGDGRCSCLPRFSIRFVERLVDEWRSCARRYTEIGKNATDEAECRRYAHMTGILEHCAEELESDLAKRAALETNEGHMEGLVYDCIERRLGLTYDPFSSRPRYLFIVDAIDLLMQQARPAQKAAELHPMAP